MWEGFNILTWWGNLISAGMGVFLGVLIGIAVANLRQRAEEGHGVDIPPGRARILFARARRAELAAEEVSHVPG